MDQHLANLALASLADAEKLLLAPGRVSSRHEAEPRCQVTGLLELSTTAYDCQKCGRVQGSNAWDCHQATGDNFSICARRDLLRHVADALLRLAQVGKQICECR